jgi:hypothetical protein
MSAEQMPAADQSIAMLPVEIVSEQQRASATFAAQPCGTRVCLRGEVSPEMLRQVAELLR